MNHSTPEIEAILEDLTSLCCQAMQADGKLDTSRVDKLTQSLSVNGWRRHSDDDPPLGVVLEKRVRSQCPEPAMHRGASLKSIVDQVQASYDQTSRYSASAPEPQKDASRQAYSARG